MNVDIRQSEQFAHFMEEIGWKIDQVDSTFLYKRIFPILGPFAKIPRSNAAFSLEVLKKWCLKNNPFTLRIAPFIQDRGKESKHYQEYLYSHGFTIEQFPFNPTTTILINLNLSEKDLFSHFSSAKRRAVRRALKHEIIIKESEDIDSFIQIRKYQYKPLGFLISKETRKIFQSFFPRNASLLLSYSKTYKNNPVSGILMLYYGKTAYYWFASSLPIGKKLFAPTLLVWEALKIAKKRGCTSFDFEGIYDGRFPKAAESWKGFTKFKEGFGGQRIVFIENFKKNLKYFKNR